MNFKMTIKCVDNLISIGMNCYIVVVDNNSPNESYDIINERYRNIENIFVLKTKVNGGYSYGNNYGIKYINKVDKDVKYICIMNPDVEVRSRRSIIRLIDSLEYDESLTLVSGICINNNILNMDKIAWKIPTLRQEILDNFSIYKHLKKYQRKYIINEDKVAYVDVVSGCFFVIKKEDFIEIGLFDENLFLYFEENVLASKIKKINKKVGINFECIYYHNHLGKEIYLNDYRNKIKDFKFFSRSRRYFVKNYCKYGKQFYWLLYIGEFIHEYIEIPIICIINSFMKKYKRDLYSGKGEVYEFKE